jgi:DNA-binding response OmpR family regulator
VLKTSRARVEVTEVENIDQALNILENENQDVVFLDIVHPRGNGVSLIAEIRKKLQDGLIFVVSSLDTAEYKDASIENGADYFLSKAHPGSMSLVDAVHTKLRKID